MISNYAYIRNDAVHPSQMFANDPNFCIRILPNHLTPGVGIEEMINGSGGTEVHTCSRSYYTRIRIRGVPTCCSRSYRSKHSPPSFMDAMSSKHLDTMCQNTAVPYNISRNPGAFFYSNREPSSTICPATREPASATSRGSRRKQSRKERRRKTRPTTNRRPF